MTIFNTRHRSTIDIYPRHELKKALVNYRACVNLYNALVSNPPLATIKQDIFVTRLRVEGPRSNQGKELKSSEKLIPIHSNLTRVKFPRK